MNKFLVIFLGLTATYPFFSFQSNQSFDLPASIKRGEEVYINYCQSCHMDQGQGIDAVYPPLVKSDYLKKDKKTLSKIILYGANGNMIVNGKTYNLEMTGFDLSDQQVSDVLNYIRNSWGNKGEAIRPEDVKSSREK